MEKLLLDQVLQNLNALVQTRANASEKVEYFARDLQTPLGYGYWENFFSVIQKATVFCKAIGEEPSEHFRYITKMVPQENGAFQAVDDFILSRSACYWIAQSGDPSVFALTPQRAWRAGKTLTRRCRKKTSELSY